MHTTALLSTIAILFPAAAGATAVVGAGAALGLASTLVEVKFPNLNFREISVRFYCYAYQYSRLDHSALWGIILLSLRPVRIQTYVICYSIRHGDKAK